METVTTAIVAALGKLGVKAVQDGYEGLKALIKRKFGEENKVTEAVERLEQEPNSEGWKLLLEEAAAKAEADKDAESIKAAEALLAVVKKQAAGIDMDIDTLQATSLDVDTEIAGQDEGTGAKIGKADIDGPASFKIGKHHPNY